MTTVQVNENKEDIAFAKLFAAMEDVKAENKSVSDFLSTITTENNIRKTLGKPPLNLQEKKKLFLTCCIS